VIIDAIRTRRDDPSPAGILVGIGTAAVVVAAFIASALPQTDLILRYAVLAVTVCFFSAVTGRWGTSACVAIIGYLVFEGFVVNHFGELTWSGPADAARITALIAAAVFGRLIGDGVRLYRVFSDAHAEREIERARRHNS
jgi:hypothetical protein